MLYSIVILFTLVVSIYAEEPCSPKIKEGDSSILEIGGLISLDCSFITCDHVSTVVFKREGVAVYEALSKDDHKALGISNGYSLKNRSVRYFATRTNHILSIDPAQLNDHGKWSCLVIDTNGDKYTSKEIMINIYVKPKVEDILSVKNLKPVTNKIHNFTCKAIDVHPKPTLIWRLNGEQRGQVSADSVQHNGLWSVVDTIQLTFDNPGMEELECIISAGERQVFIKDTVNLDVKESAKLNKTEHPETPVHANVSFTLKCTGSGYALRILWLKDDAVIIDKERYDIQSCDSEEHQCTSTLTSKPFHENTGCDDLYGYEGEYRCIVEVDTDNDGRSESTDQSQLIPISILDTPFTTGPTKNITVTRCDNNANLKCDVCAKNPTKDMWYHNEESISQEDLKRVLDKKIHSRYLEYGEYKRIVETSEGTTLCVVHYIAGSYELCPSEKAVIVVGACTLPLIFVALIVYLYIKGMFPFKDGRGDREKPWKFSPARANEQPPLVDDTTKVPPSNETVACDSGPVYVNVNKSGAPTQAPPLEAIYSQVNKPKKGQVVAEPTKANDPDELRYAEVEVTKGKNKKKKTSPKTKNPVYESTAYASIDRSKSANSDGP